MLNRMETHPLKVNGPVGGTAAVEALVLPAPAVFGLVGHVRHPLDRVIDQVVRVCLLVIPALDSTALLHDLVNLEVRDVAAGLRAPAWLCR